MTMLGCKRRLVGMVFVLLFGLAGCVESETPLSDPQTAKVDNRLTGIWRGGNGQGKSIALVCGPSDVKGHSPGMMRLEWIELDEANGTFRKSINYFFVSNVGNQSFMNVIGNGIGSEGRIKPSNGEAGSLEFPLQGEYEALLGSTSKKVLLPNYSFLRYEVERGSEGKNNGLRIWGPSEDIAKSAVQKRALKGVPVQGDGHPIFKDSAENLAKFFQSDLGKEMFATGEKQVLVRIK